MARQTQTAAQNINSNPRICNDILTTAKILAKLNSQFLWESKVIEVDIYNLFAISLKILSGDIQQFVIVDKG